MAQRLEPCAKLMISVGFTPNKTRLCLKLFLKPILFSKISNFKRRQRDSGYDRSGSQFYGAPVKHMHPLMLTNGTKFKIGTNSATKREDTICFHPLARWSLERVFLLTSVRTENGLGSGRARPLALELPMGCPSFLLSFQGYVESAKRSYSTSLMLSCRIAIDLRVPLS